ncbi:MAG: hypothetical protein U9R32_02810 [Bacteroidota bacterium]|nr:hypothetical protein [Bacteroidota bacterium]
MNYFDKNRLIIGLVIFITVINLASLGTIFYMVTNRGAREILPPPLIMEDRSFDGDRNEGVDFRFMDSARARFRTQMMPLHNDLKRVQSETMVELRKANPDSVKLDSLAVESSLFYLQMKKKMINDFVRLNRRCNVGERQRLNRFYQRFMIDGRREMRREDERMQRRRGRMRNDNESRRHRNRF